MELRRFAPYLALAVLATASTIASAQGTLFRAYVSLNGNDANACTLPSPCRLLPRALSAVAPGGEIWMLDSANYNTGPVTIDKAVTILAIPGALGSVVASGATALSVATTDAVTLRNLNILPLPGSEAATGIAMTQAGVLTVQDCNVSGFTGGRGLAVTAAARATVLGSVLRGHATAVFASTGARVSLMDSTVLDSVVAIQANAFLPNETVFFAATRTRVRGGGSGVVAASSGGSGQVGVDISDSRFEDISGTAVSVSALVGTVGRLLLSNSVITGNGTGVFLGGTVGARAYLAGNSISGNFIGANVAAATTALSTGTNMIRGNDTDVQGTISTIPGQ